MSIREWFRCKASTLTDEPFHEVQRIEYSPADFIVVYVGTKGLSRETAEKHAEDITTRLKDLLKHENFVTITQERHKSIHLTILAKVPPNEDHVEGIDK